MSLAAPEQVRVWTFSGKSGNLRSQNNYATNTGYSLHCQTNNKFLTYVKTNVGINLGYAGPGDRKVHIRLPDGAERDILTGEPFALGIGGKPSFLKYAERRMGINLEYSEKPIYEWRILTASGVKGQPIPQGQPVAIMNEKVLPEADFLVYLDRPVGADIGWTTSPHWFDKFLDDEIVRGAIKAARTFLAG